MYLHDIGEITVEMVGEAMPILLPKLYKEFPIERDVMSRPRG